MRPVELFAVKPCYGTAHNYFCWQAEQLTAFSLNTSRLIRSDQVGRGFKSSSAVSLS